MRTETTSLPLSRSTWGGGDRSSHSNNVATVVSQVASETRRSLERGLLRLMHKRIGWVSYVMAGLTHLRTTTAYFMSKLPKYVDSMVIWTSYCKPNKNRFWRLKGLLWRQSLASTNSRNWPRKWCRPSHLGSCEYYTTKRTLQEEPENARRQLQAAIDTWEFSLKATCGAIVPEKTVWWLVSFIWSRSSWRYAGIQDSPGELTVQDIAKTRKVIKWLEPHQAYETLGVFLAPDGNLEEQFQKMLTVANKWAENLRTGIISRNEAWLALQSTIMRTLVYPLPAIRLTKSRCESILASLRHFPRKLVHSTLDYMGLDIKHLFFLQEIMHIKDIICTISMPP